MRVTRCHVDLPLHVGADLALPERAANHLVRVLRLREGDACVLFNGDGHDYPARLAAIGKREVRVEVLAREPVAPDAVERVDVITTWQSNEQDRRWSVDGERERKRE